MRRFFHPTSLISLIIVISLIILGLATSAAGVSGTAPSAAEAVQASWRLAQEAGAYHYNTEIMQTTYPTPILANVGRGAKEDLLYMEGQVNLPARELLMTLWSRGGSAANSQDGVEVHITGDEAYGRGLGEEWQKIDNFTGIFAPGQDLMAYLAGARNVHLVSDAARPVVPGWSQYEFELDGASFGSYVRKQLEQSLLENGELPPGVNLQVSDQYRGMTGSGAIWLDGEGLPARLTVSAKFPQQENGQRVAVTIKSDFSDFAHPALQAGLPNLIGSLTGLRTPGQFQETAMSLSLMSLTGLLGLFLISQRRSRLVYSAVIATVIFSLIFSPFLQSHQVYAFTQRQFASQAGIEKSIQEQELVDSLFTSTWDPHQAPLQTAASQPAQGAASTANLPLAPLATAADASTTTGASLTCTDIEIATDTDQDGLTNCVEKQKQTDPAKADSNGDGLTDGQEVLFLGTDPLSQDTDGDGITDNAEVAGFSYNGQKWYSNPNNPDTNADGQIDGLECPEMMRTPGQLSPSGLACRDLDGDGTPDLFDDDNDGDGVTDRMDLSFNKAFTGFTSANPFKLVVQNLTANKDVFVDIQVRPTNPQHLTYALNILDWPTGDTQGQVTRTKDTTFADTLTAAQAAASPSSANGDLRMTPMLEIILTGETLPLPRTAPAGTRSLSTALSGWIEASASFTQDGGNSLFTLTHDNAAPLESVTLYTGSCISAILQAVTATAGTTFTHVASGSQQTITGQKLLSVMDGNHALLLKQGADQACLNLGDLPNGLDPDQMIDTTTLSSYGVSVRDADRNGKVVAYVPLNMVTDKIGDMRQAFTARMPFRQSGTAWGNAQEIRLIWLVELLNDSDQIQTIHTYPDDFSLTGLSVREDHGLTVSVAFEDPAVDQDVNIDDALWQVAEGLRAGFTSGRQNTSAQRDLTLADLKTRFDNSGNTDAAKQKRWGLNAGAVKVLNYSFSNQDGLAQFPTSESKKILDTYFTSGGTVLASTPTLLFAREEIFRDLNLGAASGVTSQGNQITLDLDPARQPLQTLAAFNWSPYKSTGNGWQPYKLSEYWDIAAARYRDTFTNNPPAYLTQTDPGYEKMLDTMVLLARSNYVALMQGEMGLVKRGSDVLTNFKAAEPDFKLADKIINGTIGTAITSTTAVIAEDMCMNWAKRGLMEISDIARLGPAEAFKKTGEMVDRYMDYGKNNIGKTGFALSDGWGNAGMGLVAVTAVMSIVAVWSGNGAADKIAGVLNAASAIFGLVDAIGRAATIVKTAKLMGESMMHVSKMLEAGAQKAAVVGMIVSAGMAVGMFIAQCLVGGFTLGGLAFNAVLAALIASIIVAVIMLAITLIPIVGQVIAALLGAIDGVLAAICKFTGWTDEEKEEHDFICGGATAYVGKFIENTIYSTQPLVVNLEDENRLEFLGFNPSLVNPAGGYAVDGAIRYQITVRNKITLLDPANPPEGTDVNWKSLAFSYQFTEANLKDSAFAYILQTAKNKLPVTYSSMVDQWKALAGTTPTEFYMPDVDLAITVANSTVGINQPAGLYLSESYVIPTQECFGIPTPVIVPVCHVRADQNIIHNNLGDMIKWDVFPGTLDGFYEPHAREQGYSLAWGQSPHIINPETEEPVIFPRMKDFDGDGLLNKTDGGMDPNDSLWDTDNDGLSDPYELTHGTDPQTADSDSDGMNDYVEVRQGTDPLRADSDGDGLTDLQEITGWEIIYGFQGGIALKTWVKSDPLQADADSDGLTDDQEKILGTNPNVPNSATALTYSARLSEPNAARLLLRFEETASAAAFTDGSGLGRSVSCSGTTCPASGVTGYYGNALEFDGVDDAARVSSLLNLDNTSFSVAFWARRASNGGSQWIVAQGSLGVANQALTIGFQSNNTFACNFGSNGLSTSITYTDTAWHHYACTYKSGNRQRTIYVDGSQAAQATASANFQGSGDLLIGAGLGGAFKGFVDELGVYGAALTQAQIQSVQAARYPISDLFVNRGDPLLYEGTVRNELNNRYAQGLLRTDASTALLNSINPTTFVLQPADQKTVSGTLTVSGSAPSGPAEFTQVASGQIVDWREASDYADLWLKFDETGTVTSFNDSSGFVPARNAACSGAVCPSAGQAGMRSSAAAFDGADDFLTATNSAGLNPAYLTIAAWVKAANFNDEGAAIVTKGTGGGGEAWNLDFMGGGKPRMYFYKSGSLSLCQADNAISTSTWHHVAGTYDGANIIVYVDGSAVKTCAAAKGPLSANTHAVSIGSRQSGSSAYDLNYAGLLDDVRVYPRALTSAQVGALFSTPALRMAFEGTSSSGGPGQADDSGSGNTVTCESSVCPTKTGGVAGGGAAFSGTQYLQVTSANNSLDLSSGRFTQAAWVYPEAPVEVIPVIAHGCTTATPLWVEYFNSQDLSGSAVLSRCEAFPQEGLNPDWGSASPDAAVDSDGFSIRWNASFRFNTTGVNNFEMGGDDGFRASWDGSTFISDWNTGGYRSTSAAPTLTAGTHQLTLEYFEATGGARARFFWKQWSQIGYPQGILGKDSGETNGYPALVRVGNKLRVGFGSGSAWTEFTTPGDVLTPNNWNHVAASFDGTTYRLYVNGIEKANTNLLSGKIPSSGSNFWVGRSANKGSITLHRIYVDNEGDGIGNAELCMAWKDSPSAAQVGFWSELDASGGNSYEINQVKTFTETGYLSLWENDQSPECGDNKNGTDDYVWDRTFKASELSMLDETEFKFSSPAQGYPCGTSGLSCDSTGSLFLGDHATRPYTPALLINTEPLRGRVDDVQVFRYPLSASDITALYQGSTVALHLRFDDPSGAGLTSQGFSNAVDPSNATNGTCPGSATCPTSGLPGRVNLAAQFDGLNDYVEVANNTSLTQQQIGISAWVKASSWQANVYQGVIVGKDDATSGNHGYTLRAGNNGQVSFNVSVDGAWCEAVTGQILSTGVWAHLTGSYDGSSVTVYVNGAQAATNSCAGRISHSSLNLNLGRSPTWTDRLFAGLVDDVRIYRTGLSLSEAQALYQAAPAFQIHFEETSNAGGFANSGTGPAGSCTGPACPSAAVNGQVGLAALFDGVNDVVTVSDDASLKPSQITAAAWIKASVWANEMWRGVILGKDSAATGNQGYTLRAGDNGRASFVISINGAWCEAFSPQIMTPGIWTHIAGSYDGAAARIYVNGVLQASTTCAGTISHSTTALNIGRSPYWTDRLFNGAIDEVLIYSNALSNQSIGELYRMQAKYVEDRVDYQVTVDTAAPLSALKSYAPGTNYRKNAAQVLGITANDTSSTSGQSGVGLVELGACRGSGCTPAWSTADTCLDASGIAWCPTFDPTTLGGEGRYALQTRATDNTGLRETPSLTYTVYVDGTPPVAASAIPGGALLPVLVDPYRDGWVVALSGAVSDPVLATGEAGSGAASLLVTLIDGSGAVAGVGEQSARISSGVWTLNYSFDVLPSGAYTLKLMAADAVGNTASPVSLSLKIDSTAPIVTLDTASIPQTTITTATTITGTVTEAPAGSGNFSGIQRLDAAFFADSPALYNETQALSGQMRYFPLDDQTSALGQLVFTDLAGGQNGACATASPQTCPATGIIGRSGSAVEFDGTNDAISAGSDLNLANASFSVAFWAQRSATGRLDPIIGQGSLAANQGLNIGFQADNQFVCGFTENELRTAADTGTGWHFWTCTYNAGSGLRTIYRDGAQVAQDTASANYQGSGIFYLGRGAASTAYFSGVLDNVTIFNRAISAVEVQTLAGGGGSTAQPVLALPFDWPRAVNGTPLEVSPGGLSATLSAGSDDPVNKAVAGNVGSYALNFDGVNDYVTVTHDPILNVDYLTIAGWVRPTAIPETGAPLLTKGSGSGGEAWNLDFDSGRPHLYFYKGGSARLCLADGALTIGAWQHVAGTYDGANIRIYVNGNLVKTCAAPYGALEKNEHAVTVGSRQSASAGYDLNFGGAMDDVRLYRRALSALEIKELVYTGWQPAALSSSGSGVATANATITLPSGLEGGYRLALRSTDVGGNFTAAQANAWNGSVDTLAPRLTLTRTYPAANLTRFEVTAEDFNLKESTLEFTTTPAPCTLQVTERQNYQSPWYKTLAGPAGTILYSLKASCTVSAREEGIISARICDSPNNCTTASTGSGLLADNASPAELPQAPNAQSGLYAVVSSPVAEEVLTSGGLISISGRLHADAGVKTLSVKVDSEEPLFILFTEGDLIVDWSANWVSSGSGRHIITVEASDLLAATTTTTHVFYIDTIGPEVTLTSTQETLQYSATGSIELRGTTTDDAGLASVVIEVADPADTFSAVVENGAWVATWPLGLSAAVDGTITYHLTITATDLAGRTAILTPSLRVDVTPPDLSIDSVQFDAANAIVGQVYPAAALSASITFTTQDANPSGGVDYAWYAWTTSPIEPDIASATTIPVPGTTPINVTVNLEANPVQAGTARYLHVGAVDLYYGNRTALVLGPYYQDPAGLPDYTSLNEPSGPLAGQVYRAWLDNGCTWLGSDSRASTRTSTGGSVQTQKFYATRDSSTLSFTWTGANWDSDGDLFIYLDSVPDPGYFPGPEWTHAGGYLAYNPYAATNPNTLVLLPVTDRTFASDDLPLKALEADYAIWVQNSQTATLLQWNNTNQGWDEIATLPRMGEMPGQEWGYRYSPADGGFTDLRIPLETVGIDPSGVTGGIPLGLVAFATDESALRLWAVMPPANPVNSSRVANLAPAIGQPAQLILSEQYDLTLADGECQAGAGRLQATLIAQPGALGISSTDEDVRLVLPIPSAGAFPAWDTSGPDAKWAQMVDRYNNAYQAWLSGTFCVDPANSWDPACGNDPRSTYEKMASALAPFTQVEYPPVAPGGTVTYNLKYTNDGPAAFTDVWAVLLVQNNAIELIDTASTYCGRLISVGNIAANSTAVITFTGVAGAQGFTSDNLFLNLYEQAQISGLDTGCGDPSGIGYTGLGQWLAGMELLGNQTGSSSPTYAAIQTPRTVITTGVVTVQGVVFDSAPVPTIKLTAQGPHGSGDVTCTDTTPTDGAWSCAWDTTATNGSIPPVNGDVFTLSAEVTNAMGFTALTLPVTLVVDTQAPAINLDSTFEPGSILLSGDRPVLSGSIRDNRLVSGLDVCDSAGASCLPAAIVLDAETIAPTVYTYNDIPAAPVAIEDFPSVPPVPMPETFCASPVVRTFTVADSFVVSDLQLGLNLTHAYRRDVSVILRTPGGVDIALIPALSAKGLNNRRNYAVLLGLAASQRYDVDWFDHAPGEPYFKHARLPDNSPGNAPGDITLAQFLFDPTYAGQRGSQGDWTLTVCDTVNSGSGTYNRSQLILHSDPLPDNTLANWSYTLPGVENSDNLPYTVTLFAKDSVGNRTPVGMSNAPLAGQTVTFNVDNVAPQITATQRITTMYISDAITVLEGSVFDGSSVFVTASILNPLGVQTLETLVVTGNVWRFDFSPDQTGQYTLNINATDTAGNLTTSGPYYLTAGVDLAPLITSGSTGGGVEPVSGSILGGTVVTITGNNLTGATSVTFGGTASAGDCTVVDDSTLECTTPAHVAGAVNVVVITPNGSATSTSGFTYVPTAVNLASFKAFRGGAADVFLSWETVSEISTVGFNIYRKSSGASEFVKLNQELIPALAPGEFRGMVYTFHDLTASPGRVYFYTLEAIGTSQQVLYSSDPLLMSMPYQVFLGIIVRP